jgi:hypothetical protein
MDARNIGRPVCFLQALVLNFYFCIFRIMGHLREFSALNTCRRYVSDCYIYGLPSDVARRKDQVSDYTSTPTPEIFA